MRMPPLIAVTIWTNSICFDGDSVTSACDADRRDFPELIGESPLEIAMVSMQLWGVGGCRLAEFGSGGRCQ